MKINWTSGGSVKINLYCLFYHWIDFYLDIKMNDGSGKMISFGNISLYNICFICLCLSSYRKGLIKFGEMA